MLSFVAVLTVVVYMIYELLYKHLFVIVTSGTKHISLDNYKICMAFMACHYTLCYTDDEYFDHAGK
uniref:Secreted protein n=1 Tax=Heterorhabditis bacteriophora TaxID=37862 RepID=A0A1I7W883_HETBA